MISLHTLSCHIRFHRHLICFSHCTTTLGLDVSIHFPIAWFPWDWNLEFYIPLERTLQLEHFLFIGHMDSM